MERTLILLKPDAVQRALVGTFISRFEAKGLKLVGLKLLRMSRELAQEHYQQHQGKGFYEPLLEFITAGPIVAMVLDGNQAVQVTRTMMGKTFGPEAEPGTLRGDFGLSKRYNLVHGSDSPEVAQQEIARFFRPEEQMSYDRPIDEWVYASEEKSG